MSSVILYLIVSSFLILGAGLVVRRWRNVGNHGLVASGIATMLCALPYMYASVLTSFLDPRVRERIATMSERDGQRVTKVVALPYPASPLTVYVETLDDANLKDGYVMTFQGSRFVRETPVWTENGSLSGNVFPPQWNADP